MVRAKTTPAAKAASPNPAAATFGASSGKDGAATMRMEKIVMPDGREITPANVNANSK